LKRDLIVLQGFMVNYSIIQKSQLEGAHRLGAEKWFKYIKPIYKKRKKLKTPIPQDRGLIFTIDSGKYKRLADLIQKVIKNVINAEQIFGITKQLNDKSDPDEKINDMVAELRAAKYLIEDKYQEIIYQKKALDFRCNKNNNNYLVEVKFFRGPNFKTQEKLPFKTGGYKLVTDKLINLLEMKLKQALEQFNKYDTQNQSKHLLIFVTNLLEVEKGWRGEAIEEWCRKQNQQQAIEAICLTGYGDIYK